MNRKWQLSKYLVFDFLSAVASWTVFQHYWRNAFENGYDPVGIPAPLRVGLILVPIFWLILYYLSGYYRDVFRKSRLSELGQTVSITFLGTLLLFIVLQFLPTRPGYRPILSPFISLMAYHFVFTYLPRAVITTMNTHRVHRGEIGFNTLIIGSSNKAIDIYHEIMSQPRGSGNKFVGFVSLNHHANHLMGNSIPHLGNLEHIGKTIQEKNVEEVIIAIETSEHDMINRILNKLIDTRVVVKAIPSMYDILTGRVRMSSILGTPLISVSQSLMPVWQYNLKSLIDYSVALFALVVTLPITLFLVIGIKLTSRGPIFYSHERIGRYGKPFVIYKFRSMYIQAEKNGPELSSRSDGRITPFGRFMRKSRLDEIPNFLNVLKGDMSLVGPRPERKYFIDRIVEQAPHYLHLLKVKPGITSWGQVKFGYAENVEQMIERLKYDLIYLDNMSLYVDLKIIIYTVMTIIKRKGI
jgi:exopolysaccharide biosynthesis polyprenyl glycosylphosphotransferase